MSGHATDAERLIHVEQAMIGLREEQKGMFLMMQGIQARQGESQEHTAAMGERFSRIEAILKQLVDSADASQKNHAKGTPESTKDVVLHESEGITMASKLKIWQNTMGLNKVSRKGDYNFPAAKQDYSRLHSQFGLPAEIEKELVMQSFEKSALKVANQVMREFPDVGMSKLWELLEDRLYNDSQRRAQNTAFLQLQWNERKDSLNYFAEAVHSQGLSLGIDRDLIRATFIKGLPARLQTYAYGITGSYDEVVSAVANISGTLSRSGRNQESVREVQEGESKQSRSVPKDASTVANTNTGTNTDWKKNRRCYACGELGHISKDPQCTGKRNDATVPPSSSGNRGNVPGSAQKI